MNQLLASAGYGSRRHCEELITEGRVAIDGKIVEQLGIQVDPENQTVHVDGVLLRQQKLVYFAVNKPTGVVTTNSDPQGRARVIDLVPPTQRVFPVGRLDRSSEGLILLTNDGDLAQQLAHPKFGVQKVYRVTVAGKVDGEALKKMRNGIYIAEGHVKVDGAKVLKARPKATDMEIRLREGKNREIRRILARLGHKVQQLKRVAIGPLKLGEIPAGAYRVLTKEEIVKLKAAADQVAIHGRGEEETPSRPMRKKSASPWSAKKKTAKRPASARPPRDPSAIASDDSSAGPAPRKTSFKAAARPAKLGDKPERDKPDRIGAKPARTVEKPAKAIKRPAKKVDSIRVGAVIGADPKPKSDREERSKREKPIRGRTKGTSAKKKALMRGGDKPRPKD